MDREEMLAIIRDAVEANVKHAGMISMPILPETSDQVAIDIVDALENAGFIIVRTGEPNS